MAAVNKPIPVIKGDAAKKLAQALKNPHDNSKLFRQCDEQSKKIKIKLK